MSSMDPMKVDSWTLYGIKQSHLLRPHHFSRMLNTRSSLLMRLITQPTMYNSYYGRTLRRFITTVDSSSHVTTKTRSSNRYTADVVSWTSHSQVKKNKVSLLSSSRDSIKFLLPRMWRQIKRLLRRLFRSIYPIGGEF